MSNDQYFDLDNNGNAQAHEKTRVMFFLNSLGIGGSERKIVRLANYLSGRGFDVYLTYLNAPHTLLPKISKKIQVRCLHREGKFSFQAASLLRSALTTEQISIVFVVNLYPLLYLSIARLTTQRPKIPYVALVNTSEFLPNKATQVIFAYRPALNRAQKIVFGCKQQQKQWVSRYRLSAARSCYIYNGVDLREFRLPLFLTAANHLRQQLKFDEQTVVIGCLGQLRPEKHHSDLIEAVEILTSNLPGIRLMIVGDGPMRSSLEKLVCEKGLQNIVIFLGEVQDPRTALAAMDVFALPSVAVETFSNAALEAMAMERPIVLSDVGGAREMIEEGRNGIVYPRGNVEDLSRALAYLCSDASIRKEMGSQARRIVEENFSIERMYSEYESIIAREAIN